MPCRWRRTRSNPIVRDERSTGGISRHPALEKRMIENALQEAGGNRTEAANRLQINRLLLYNKMVEHGIED
ncbi:MAG TPA: helix-turn-helix domain-containing protein [Candidatus Acidoferrales bacterium]|nr:helix-turn-helix domain-containing protein [Candidatus Acidoferrales bacterium]